MISEINNIDRINPESNINIPNNLTLNSNESGTTDELEDSNLPNCDMIVI